MGVSIVLRCCTGERVDFCMEYGRQFSGHGMLTLGCLDMVASSVKTGSKGVIIEMDNWLGFWGDSKVKRLVVWGNKCTWIIDRSVCFQPQQRQKYLARVSAARYSINGSNKRQWAALPDVLSFRVPVMLKVGCEAGEGREKSRWDGGGGGLFPLQTKCPVLWKVICSWGYIKYGVSDYCKKKWKEDSEETEGVGSLKTNSEFRGAGVFGRKMKTFRDYDR